MSASLNSLNTSVVSIILYCPKLKEYCRTILSKNQPKEAVDIIPSDPFFKGTVNIIPSDPFFKGTVNIIPSDPFFKGL